MSNFKEYFSAYAAHGAWANDLIFESLRHVSDGDYHRVLLPGIRNMHDLLNHMIIMDELWLGEITLSPRIDIKSGHDVPYADRALVEQIRRSVDRKLEQVFGELDEAVLAGPIQYEEYTLRWPMWVEIAHIFRHQTHHRGQMSALIGALGLEPPKLDPMFLPPRAAAKGEVYVGAEVRKAVYG